MKQSAGEAQASTEWNEGSGRFLEVSSWKRREHFELFRGFANPFFSVCVDVDATATWERCAQADSPSFHVATLFHSLRAANGIEAFRMRIRGDRVWVHDSVRASATILREDETFGFGIFPPAPSLEEFARRAVGEVAAAKRIAPLVLPRPGEDDLIYHSSLPWMRFTAFGNALNGGKDSVPRVVFGRCAQRGGRWLLPVAVEVHHALVDGLDVARYLEAFQAGLS
ncbi:MAG: CatA-like O-acetyltransferase [Gemmatimonadaceae bacterium]|nr:CatA-like O-acetyltransferase [Gemmatimonadaceae bacterium]